jgi:hypothetical protein
MTKPLGGTKPKGKVVSAGKELFCLIDSNTDLPEATVF